MQKLLDWLGNKMRVLGCLCILGMAVLTVADVIGRLNRQPIFGSEEIVTFLAVLALGLSLPYGHAHRTHIGVEVFVQLMPTRVRRVLKVLTESVAIVFFAVITVMMAAFGHDKQLSGEVSMNLGLSEHLVIFALAACFAVVTMAMTVDLIRSVQKWGQS